MTSATPTITLAQIAGETTIDGLSRGMPAYTPSTPIDQMGRLGLVVHREDLTLPVLTLSETAFAHNIAVMNDYAAEQGVHLCAHGKTMMAPQLLEAVLAGHRTIGLCAATVPQASVMAACGAPTVFIANQVIGRSNIARLTELMGHYPTTRFLLLIDSTEGIDQLLHHGTSGLLPGAAFNLLIEIGPPGGRAGVRDIAQAEHLLAHIRQEQNAGRPIVLAGVSTYEGSVPPGTGWATRVDALLSLTAAAFRAALPLVDPRHPPIVSAGGSATFDLVVNADAFRNLPGHPQIWLRPGVAPTYDHVIYQDRLREVDERHGFALQGKSASAVTTFRPALALWAVVQSIPEPGLAIIGAGIRDFPADAGYPTLLTQYRAGEKIADFTPRDISIARANDQHAYLEFDASLDPQIGDVLQFGISHPCTAFDRWPILFCVDDNNRITRAVRTYF